MYGGGPGEADTPLKSFQNKSWGNDAFCYQQQALSSKESIDMRDIFCGVFVPDGTFPLEQAPSELEEALKKVNEAFDAAEANLEILEQLPSARLPTTVRLE